MKETNEKIVFNLDQVISDQKSLEETFVVILKSINLYSKFIIFVK